MPGIWYDNENILISHKGAKVIGCLAGPGSLAPVPRPCQWLMLASTELLQQQDELPNFYLSHLPKLPGPFSCRHSIKLALFSCREPQRSTCLLVIDPATESWHPTFSFKWTCHGHGGLSNSEIHFTYSLPEWAQYLQVTIPNLISFETDRSMTQSTKPTHAMQSDEPTISSRVSMRHCDARVAQHGIPTPIIHVSHHTQLQNHPLVHPQAIPDLNPSIILVSLVVSTFR
jgi:hypothetical protein